jgi:hypothetical protein
MLKSYIECNNKASLVDNVNDLIQSSVEANLTTIELISEVCAMCSQLGLNEDLLKFIKNQGEFYKTWMFWDDFVFKNCYAYITLFLSIR